MRIFGVDPGSVRTGYGCVDLTDSRYRVVVGGVLSVPAKIPFPDKLKFLHDGLAELLAQHRPDAVAVEDLFYAKNARSAPQAGDTSEACSCSRRRRRECRSPNIRRPKSRRLSLASGGLRSIKFGKWWPCCWA